MKGYIWQLTQAQIDRELKNTLQVMKPLRQAISELSSVAKKSHKALETSFKQVKALRVSKAMTRGRATNIAVVDEPVGVKMLKEVAPDVGKAVVVVRFGSLVSTIREPCVVNGRL